MSFAPVEVDTSPQPVLLSYKPRTDDDPVIAALRVEDRVRPGREFEVSVVLDVAPGYEVRKLGAAPPASPTELTLDLPEGFELVGEWESPQTERSMGLDDHPVHTGEAEFTVDVRVADDVLLVDHELFCKVGYQACTAEQCLRPVEHKLRLRVGVR
ncbi:MAG: hypothetical protein AAGA92_01045 [Planctomycetota bacterium]